MMTRRKGAVGTMGRVDQVDNGRVLEEHHWRLRAVEDGIRALTERARPRDWLDGDLTEPAVQIAIRDLLHGGDCAFDVGANFGGLSMLMSRLVGPRGAVCAFEANPNIARRCQQYLVSCGCGNVQLYNNAVYNSSMQALQLYVSANSVSDSLYNKVSDISIPVISLALDDFIAEMGLRPALVKMDIEGAEYDALLGFERTISRARPVLILEQQIDDDRCLSWLSKQDYTAIDLYEYKAISKFQELTRGTAATDILYLPRERVAETVYRPPFSFEPGGRLTAADLYWATDRVFLSRNPVELIAGRYRLNADFSAADPGTELKVGVADGQQPLMRYHGTSGWLARVGRTWIIDVSRPLRASVFFEFPAGVDPDFEFHGLDVERVPQFDHVYRRPWI
jgi:FkbM family methyltransferase